MRDRIMRYSYLMVIAAMLGFAQAASAAKPPSHIVVLVSPITPYVNTILTGAGVAQNLLFPGQDPHHFDLAPSQAKMLDEAEILIVPDLSISPMLAERAAKNTKLRVIELSKLDGANPLPYAKDNPWLAAVKKQGHDVDDDAPEQPPAPTSLKKRTGLDDPSLKSDAPAPTPLPPVDPHFWLDPERMAAIALPLARALAESAPTDRPVLEANARDLARHLRLDVMPAMRELLAAHGDRYVNSTKPIVPFVTYHAAYQYFLARFDLGHGGEITTRPEDYLGAKSLDTLLQSAKTTRVRCIIGEVNSSLVERIAALAQAQVIILGPEQNVSRSEVPPLNWIKSDYDALLYKTAKSFGSCL